MPSNDKDYAIAVNREVVHRLMREASSEKLMRHETERALEKFRRAEKLIDQHDLPEPWPSLCAYRMGHLLLRTAATRQDLLDARSNFATAKGSKCLGPLPDIYYLAALYRLKKRNLEDIKRPFDDAKKSIESLEMKENPQLQDHMFNLLELASYFSDFDYESLEGMGLPRNPPKVPSSWILVGPDPNWANVVLTEEEALSELEELANRKECHDAVFFKLSDRKAGKKTDWKRHWKYKDKEWGECEPKPLRLLASSLQQPTRSKKDFKFIIKPRGRRQDSSSPSQLKTRLRNGLFTLTGISKKNIFDESLPGFLRLKPELRVFWRRSMFPSSGK